MCAAHPCLAPHCLYVAGWCPLGLLPSCPPQSTPEAYHFFPFFLTAGNAQVIKVFPSSAIQFAVRSVGGAALNAALQPLVGMVGRPRAAELLQQRMAPCLLMLHPPRPNVATPQVYDACKDVMVAYSGPGAPWLAQLQTCACLECVLMCVCACSCHARLFMPVHARSGRRCG